MKKVIVVLAMVLIITNLISAHGDETLAEGEELIEQKVPCENLSDEQLASIGDYYMEQMHPGEQHERMDRMMGGEGSESLRNMHIRMARNMYCGQHNQVSAEDMHSASLEHHEEDSGSNLVQALYVVLLIGVVGLVYYGIRNFRKDD